MHWFAYLWPGFPHLWNRGSWAGLALAVGFTVLLNALLAATLVWAEWMSPGVRQIGYGVLAVIWSLAWLESRADWRRYLAERRVVELSAQQTIAGSTPGAMVDGESEELVDRLFRDAQVQYLAGDWVRCEQLLRQLLKLDKRDVEGRLLLASMWRHLGRMEEAARHLHRLERLEAAAPWSYEIARELDAIAGHFDRSVEEGTIHEEGEEGAIHKMATMISQEAATSGVSEEQPAQREQLQQTDNRSPRAA